ncbi:MAG TPA: hypothetical protein VGP04_19960 [Pseudonocardiaceae bacterium]|jgi:hypothetical protein|nr:hypothetical protein [Pseudonocardiaceae bacterium]
MSVAIVAYDDRNAESDLATYRATFSPPACTTANGRFRKFNESGQASPCPGRIPAGPAKSPWTSPPQRRHQPQQRHLRRSTVHR